ncbi:MAG: hypothetical protein KA010_02535 [Saprospiraceae bacterium]|nr:hypothetical protein [Saprospiraceae bacterium]
MGCSSCSVSKGGGCSSGGCNNGCSTGGCNRLNTYDWLAKLDIQDNNQYDIVEVSFKNGARKEFYRNPSYTRTITGDVVVVETDSGYDMGKISLSGELVKLQIRKKRIKENNFYKAVLRKANERDLEKLQEARKEEVETMIKSRAIARALDLEMKIGDVEYQADKRKATFYYTADGRVDFRELIRHYAKEFKVKIEMRQIGARQESARIGGLGSCGRELCCSTWLTDFQSVSTTAARYQNLAINQSKLSGQCGRLKCCLNYELDTYLDALEDFPMEADYIQTKAGRAILVKTDIFKRLMYYAYEGERGGKFYAIDTEAVSEMLDLNQNGVFPESLSEYEIDTENDAQVDFEDVTGAIELPEEIRKKKRRKKKKPQNNDASGSNASNFDRNSKPKSPPKVPPPPPPLGDVVTDDKLGDNKKIDLKTSRSNRQQGPNQNADRNARPKRPDNRPSNPNTDRDKTNTRDNNFNKQRDIKEKDSNIGPIILPPKVEIKKDIIITENKDAEKQQDSVNDKQNQNDKFQNKKNFFKNKKNNNDGRRDNKPLPPNEA